MLDRLRMRLRALLRRDEIERELDEELGYHLEKLTEQNLRLGMSRDEARLAALRSFGGVEQSKEECRDARGVRLLDETLRDVRYGIRTLRKSPGFTFAAILSLMLGIGANTAIFQLIDAVRLRTLPVERPQELVEVRLASQKGLSGRFESWHPSLTNPLWEQIRECREPFAGVFAWGDTYFDLAASGEQRYARGVFVSGDFFDALGARPAIGRLLGPVDDKRGSNASVAVVSHAFWQREYGGSPSVLGRTITLDGRQFEIVGVAQEGFFGLEPGRPFDVAVPIAADTIFNGEETRLDVRNSWWLAAAGRLEPGWTAERATSYLETVSPGVFEATLPPTYDAELTKRYLASRLEASPAATGISQLREQYETSLWLLLAIAGLVLLIACANLANLLLARASVQEREMAVRLALGASRARLVKQLLTESLLLAAAGACLGLAAARFLSQTLVSFLHTEVRPVSVDLGLDWRVFGFAAALAVATCVLFGVAPALRATRTSAGAALKSGGRGSTEGRERLGLRRALVATQVALSLVLVVGAILFVRSLVNLVTVDTGFRRNGIVVAQVDMSRLGLPPERRDDLKRELVERARAVPGVASASDVGIVPLSGSSWNEEIWMDGADPAAKALSNFNTVGPGFFATMEIPLLAGRDFDDRDTVESPKVAVVNEEFARRFTGGASPLGARLLIQTDSSQPPIGYEIVGLVKSASYRTLREETQPVAFVAVSQEERPDPFDNIVIRSEAAAVDVIPAVRQALAEVSDDLVFRCEPLETRIRRTLLQERLMATLSGFFGVLAVVLATVGLYGVTSYMVARRNHEIGIRMALGAMRRHIAAMVLREVATLVVIGLVAGAIAALVAARVTSALLFGVTPDDPTTLAAAAGILAAVAGAAGLLPAYRASSVDPMTALRDE